MRVIPISFRVANGFVERLHRHSKPVVGAKFSIGAEVDGELVGVAMVGRPVSRHLDNGLHAEIVRLCTNGHRNACSMLYGACRRTAKAMGYQAVYTYTLPEEGGASLRAAGFRLDKANAGSKASDWHSRPGRKVEPVGSDMVGGKWRWIA